MSWEDDIAAVDEVLGKARGSRYNPEQSTLGYLGNKLKLVPAGLLGLPGDFSYNIRDLVKAGVGYGLSKVTGEAPPLETLPGERPGGAGTFAKTLGYEDLKAPGPGTELTGDVLNALASIAAFKKLPVKAGGRPNNVGPMKPEFMTTGQVVTGGVGSGVGANVAREQFPDFPGAEAIGGLAGGVAAAYPAFSPTVQTAKALLTSKGRERFASEQGPILEDVIKKNLSNRLALEMNQDPTSLAKLAESRTLAKDIPGTELDLGQMSGTPSIIQRTKGASTVNLASINEKALLDQSNREAMAKAAESPTAATNLGETALARVKQTNDKALALDQAIAQETASREAMASTVGKKEVGELGKQAREVRAEEKVSADTVVTNLLNHTTKVSAGKEFDVTPVIRDVGVIAEQPIFKYAPERKPRIIQRIEALQKAQEEPAPQLDSIGRPVDASGNLLPAMTKAEVPTKVDFKELRSMREAVGEDIRDASVAGNSTARQQRRELGKIKDAIDKAILEGGGPKVQKSYGAFLEYYRNEYAPRFLQGVNVKQTLRDSTGVEKIPNEKLFQQYLRPYGSSAARQYVALYGKNPEGRVLMRDAILDRYNKEVIGSGMEIDPRKHADFMRKYGAPLETLRKGKITVGDELSNLGEASKAAYDRLIELKTNRESLANDAFTKAVSDKLGVQTTDRIMQKVVSDPRQAKLVVDSLDKLGAHGMLEWFGKDISSTIRGAKQGGVGDALGAKLSSKEYMQAYQTALTKAYGPDVAANQIFNLRNLTKLASRIQETELNPTAGKVSGTEGLGWQHAAGFTARTAMSLLRAVVTGRTSEYDVATVLGTQYGMQKFKNIQADVMHELTTNPKAVNELITIMKEGPQSTGAKTYAMSILKRSPEVLRHVRDNMVDRGAAVGSAANVQLAEDRLKRNP